MWEPDRWAFLPLELTPCGFPDFQPKNWNQPKNRNLPWDMA